MNKITSINGIFVAPLNKLNEHVENETAHVTEEERDAWNAQTTVKAKGILMATQEDLDGHVDDTTVHITEDERATWNAKAEASEIDAKVSKETFDAHAESATIHVTAEERSTWNAKQDALVDKEGNMTLSGGLTAAGTVNANGGVNIPVNPVSSGDAVNLSSLPLALLAPVQEIRVQKSLWTISGEASDTYCGLQIKEIPSGGFAAAASQIVQWADYASQATILTEIVLTGPTGGNVLIDACYLTNWNKSIIPTSSPGTAYMPSSIQLSLFETWANQSVITGRLVGIDGASVDFSIPYKFSHSSVHRIYLLETESVLKAYLGSFASGIVDGNLSVLNPPVFLAETPVSSNPKRMMYFGIGCIEATLSPFPRRCPAITSVKRYYGKWIRNIFN